MQAPQAETKRISLFQWSSGLRAKLGLGSISFVLALGLQTQISKMASKLRHEEGHIHGNRER